MKIRTLFCLLLCSFLSAFGQSFGSKPLFIEDIKVTGTRTLDSTRLNEIVGPLNQRKVQSAEEIQERLRMRFQEFGYFDVSLDRFEAKPIDPLATPIRVHVEAEVTEGTRYRLGTIDFKDNHALTADQLRAEFPIHTGDYFSRGKIVTGLDAVRKAYSRQGYIDCTSVPEVIRGDDGRINLLLDVDEGKQYHMGKLEFLGNDELGRLLRSHWELEAGQPYDPSYVESYLKRTSSLFPDAESSNGHSSSMICQNSKNFTVNIFFELGPDHPPISTLENQYCGAQ